MELLLPLVGDDETSGIVHINARSELHQSGQVRVLMAHGIPLMTWEQGDETSESYCMVLLVRNGVASPTEVKAAFDVARATVYRALDRFEKGGLLGLVLAKRGPKGPHKFDKVVTQRMLAAKQRGDSNVAIAAMLGVTESGVRKALRRVGWSAVAPAQMALAEQPRPETQPILPLLAVEEETAEEVVEAVAAGSVVEAGHASEAQATGQADVLKGDPWDRSLDRTLAQAGLIDEALPQFGDCENVADLGVLLAVPVLVNTGALDVATRVFSGFGAAFYGVRTVILCLALMALQRIKRPEQLRHHSPPALGRVLGLDRAPEVKTLRNKVRQLADQKHSEVFMRELAKRRVESRGDAIGFLYVDGHVRVYSGKVRISKMHVTRMRLSMPATADHWVNDRDGDPLLVVTATPTTSLAKEMIAIAREIRGLLGERRVTVVFDRGGWSPELFADLIEMGFDILTYRKGHIPKVRLSKFTIHKGFFDGREVTYQLAERQLTLKRAKGKTVKVREVVRLSDDGKHQTSIVTSRTDLTAVEVAYRMFERWRQENFFKYMEAEFSIDALWAYGTEADDPDRDVPNPPRKAKERELADARAELGRTERLLGAAAADNIESTRPSMRGFKVANSAIGRRLRKARQYVDKVKAELREIPKRATAREAAGQNDVVRLKTEAKRLTDTMKSVAYQVETSLFRMIAPHYSRHEDEGRKLIASAFQLAGDIHVAPGELQVTLQAAASPNRTMAIAKLCEDLNATNTVFPGTRLMLRYAIREA